MQWNLVLDDGYVEHAAMPGTMHGSQGCCSIAVGPLPASHQAWPLTTHRQQNCSVALALPSLFRSVIVTVATASDATASGASDAVWA